MNYPATFILENGLTLINDGVTETGLLTKKETGCEAFLSLRGVRGGIYSAKRLKNGYVFYSGIFQKELDVLWD